MIHGKSGNVNQKLGILHPQADLAARVQVSGVILERDCISRIENGLRMVQDFELRAIAAALGVTTDWLLEAEEK